ncbi:hypothetical protein [Photobacterium sanguinicancri]|uniref:hypothetical protein n=1 Tax=Photobacterium sanguinicancri TaxID=875932 RepID=UPI003D0AA502
MIRLADDKISVKAADAINDHEVAESQVCIYGKKVKEKLYGLVLEECYLYQGRYLLFLTDDIPHEDILHIYYLDSDLNVLDRADIGSPYATGSFRSSVVVADNIISFNFIGNTVWTLTLFTSERNRIPFISDPTGVTRKLSFYCYFQLDGKPCPEN